MPGRKKKYETPRAKFKCRLGRPPYWEIGSGSLRVPTDPLGSFFGLELRTLDASGGLANLRLVRTVLYSKPDANLVYGAQVTTGDRVTDATNAP